DIAGDRRLRIGNALAAGGDDVEADVLARGVDHGLYALLPLDHRRPALRWDQERETAGAAGDDALGDERPRPTVVLAQRQRIGECARHLVLEDEYRLLGVAEPTVELAALRDRAGGNDAERVGL